MNPENTLEYRKTFAYRLNPTEEQKQILYTYARCSRFVFNWGLSIIKKAFDDYKNAPQESESEKIKRPPLPNYVKLSALLTELKNSPQGSWLFQAPSQITQQSLKDLESGMKHFWRRIKEKKGGKWGFPRFKNRKSNDSMRFSLGFKMEKDYVYLTRLGWINYIASRPIEGAVKQISIKRDGKYWYIFFSCILIKPKVASHGDKTVSIKLDIADSQCAIIANDLTIENKQFYQHQLDRLATVQQALRRKVRHSKNSEKCLEKLQDIHRTIRRKRNDFLHKWSHHFVENNDIVILENMPIREMLQDPLLSMALSDIGWHAFSQMIKYKCIEKNKQFFYKEIEATV